MNRGTYERGDVAAWYGKLDHLFPAERVIAELVVTPDTDMVDIGIGGGRTTRQLAHRCRSYVGMDYASTMVEVAKRTCGDDLDLRQADARDMGAIPDASADFVLFSFNGLDSVSHEDRLTILREVRRICRPRAYFASASHNLSAAALNEFAYRGGLKEAVKWALKRIVNFPLGAKLRRPWAVLNDGLHRFRIRNYYVTPAEQRRQLESAGFRGVRLFDFNSGVEIAGEQVLCPFPYYLAVAA